MNDTATPKHDPLIHIKPVDGKWGICFNRLGKVLMTVAATMFGLIATGIAAVVAMTVDNSRVLDRLDERTKVTGDQMKDIGSRVDDARQRISRLEGRTGQ